MFVIKFSGKNDSHPLVSSAFIYMALFDLYNKALSQIVLNVSESIAL